MLVSAGSAEAQPRTRADCEAAHPAALGRPGKDVPWVVTSDTVARAMLSMAEVASGDRVLDLGAGDGRIPITAAKPPFEARAVGIEYDPDLARRAACLVQVEGLAEKVRIVEGDIFAEDFGDASVVTMYLLPHLNLCVRHRILAMAPGTRVVSHQYTMADWEPEKSARVLGRDLHLWIVPAHVAGIWDFEDSEGTAFAVELHQTFGRLSGEIIRDGVREALHSPTVHGRELRFGFKAKGAIVQASGTVRDREITAAMLTGATARTAVGRLRGALRAGPWMEMRPECRSFYGR